MVSMDAKLNNIFKVNGANNPFAPARVAFTGGTEGIAPEGRSERYTNGLAPEASTGIYGGPADMGSGSREIAKKLGMNELIG